MPTHSPEIQPGQEHSKPIEQQPSVENTQSKAQQEYQVEQLREQEQNMQSKENGNTVEDAIQAMRRSLGIKKKQRKKGIPQVRDDVTVKIEKIMEDGLREAFQELTPVQAQEFKIKGEETALQIRQLLKSAHVRVKKVFKLLFDWLKMLPGINRFFLEQEAKIKTDKIVALHQTKKQK